MSDEIKLPNEVINKFYDDGLHQAVVETGKLISLIPRAVNAALSPIECWILGKEHNSKMVNQLLNESLKNADPEKIVPPAPYVAVPAIQAISYSMDSDELRNLYANLLAKSIYSYTKDMVHPAYVEIIKNLSPLDCKVFQSIMEKETQEIGYYEMRLGTVGENSYTIILPCVTELTFASPIEISASLDNLSRNKLVVLEDFHYVDDGMYACIRSTSAYKALMASFKSRPNNKELRPYPKSIKSTSFGKAFHNVCVKPI